MSTGKGLSARPSSARKLEAEEWKTCARNFQQKVNLLELSVQNNLARLDQYLNNEMRYLIDENSALSRDRVEQSAAIFSVIDSIKAQIADVESFIPTVKPDDEKACRQLKNLLDAVDEDLVAFKINRTKEFEAIGSERAQLEEAIDAALEKFHRLDSSSAVIEPIDQPPAPANYSLTETPPNSVRDPILVQVDHVQKKIDAEGGAYGGWDAVDHQYWMRLWNSCQDVEEFCKQASGEIPGQSYESVKEHYQWFKRYLAYIAHKKELIAEWRARKQGQKEKAVAQASGVLGQQDHVSSEEREKRRIEAQIKDEAILKWKEEKKAKAQEESAQRADAEALAAKEAHYREQRRMKRLREQISKYQKAKVHDKRNRTESKQFKKQADENTLEKIQLRNHALLQKKQDLLEAKFKIQKLREAHLNTMIAKLQSGIKVKPDPDRLLRDTELLAIRKLKRQADQCEPEVKNMFHQERWIPKTVPQWRRGI